MKSWLYLAGRAFQLIGLIALPSSIWVGHFGHDEQGAIAILAASVAVFYLGLVISRLAAR